VFELRLYSASNYNALSFLVTSSERVNPAMIKRGVFLPFRTFLETGSCNLLGKIKAPTLVIVGTEDAAIPIS
jgi:hypothetical protein